MQTYKDLLQESPLDERDQAYVARTFKRLTTVGINEVVDQNNLATIVELLNASYRKAHKMLAGFIQALSEKLAKAAAAIDAVVTELLGDIKVEPVSAEFLEAVCMTREEFYTVELTSPSFGFGDPYDPDVDGVYDPSSFEHLGEHYYHPNGY